MPAVSPEILSWARDRAGLSKAEAARKLAIKAAYGKTPLERLTELESGDREPTRPLVLRMAAVYRQPLITFYLAQPPEPSLHDSEFRSLSGSRSDQARIDTLVRDMQASQGLVHEILADEDAPRVPFIGTLTLDQGVDHGLSKVRELLGDDGFMKHRGAGSLFNGLREAAERAGVFVILKGNLGSHHTALDTTAFRGLALTDPLAPLIVINDNDARTAWSFTLVHEFVHLLLGRNACSSSAGNSEVERFCDDVASLFLLPEAPIRELRAARDELAANMTDIAGEWNVSRTLVAYRLLRAGHIGQAEYGRLAEEFHQSWLSQRQRLRERNRESEGGPAFYTVRRHRVGKAMLELVARSLAERSLPTRRAAVVLGVKPTQVQPMLAG